MQQLGCYNLCLATTLRVWSPCCTKLYKLARTDFSNRLADYKYIPQLNKREGKVGPSKLRLTSINNICVRETRHTRTVKLSTSVLRHAKLHAPMYCCIIPSQGNIRDPIPQGIIPFLGETLIRENETTFGLPSAMASCCYTL